MASPAMVPPTAIPATAPLESDFLELSLLVDPSLFEGGGPPYEVALLALVWLEVEVGACDVVVDVGFSGRVMLKKSDAAM